MNLIETTIIIRTRNEEKWLGAVLDILDKQTYRNFEILIVDSGSTDKTLDIVRERDTRLLQIRPEEFNYPYALNQGAEASEATKFLVLLSAHSLPTSTNWLESATRHMDENDKVMGVYGPILALPDGSIWEKLYFTVAYSMGRIRNYPKNYRVIREGGMGVMGFTNAIIRKDLWQKHRFDESYGAGGEDGEWCSYWFDRDYIAIKDDLFTVRHSHSLGLREWINQWQYWKSLSKPQPFRYLSFRKSRTHRK